MGGKYSVIKDLTREEPIPSSRGKNHNSLYPATLKKRKDSVISQSSSVAPKAGYESPPPEYNHTSATIYLDSPCYISDGEDVKCASVISESPDNSPTDKRVPPFYENIPVAPQAGDGSQQTTVDIHNAQSPNMQDDDFKYPPPLDVLDAKPAVEPTPENESETTEVAEVKDIPEPEAIVEKSEQVEKPAEGDRATLHKLELTPELKEEAQKNTDAEEFPPAPTSLQVTVEDEPTSPTEDRPLIVSDDVPKPSEVSETTALLDDTPAVEKNSEDEKEEDDVIESKP